MEADTAILRFSLAELRAAGRRMKVRLQRFPATGIFGDANRHRTLWSELRHELQHGPTLMLESTWHDTLLPFARDVVAKTPEHTKTLLCWYLTYYQGREPDGTIDEEALANAVCESVKELAAW